MILSYTDLEKLITSDELVVDELIIDELNDMVSKINYRKRERRIDLTDLINGLHEIYTNEKIKDILNREILSMKNDYVVSECKILKPYLNLEYNLFNTHVPKSYRYYYECPYLLIKLYKDHIDINIYRENRKNTATFRNIKVVAYYNNTQTTVVYQHKNFNE